MALPGDNVCYRHGSIFLNGRYLASPLERDVAGRTMPVWRASGRLADDDFFVMAGFKTSLDSWYFGPLDPRLIVGKPCLYGYPALDIYSLFSDVQQHGYGTISRSEAKAR